MENKIRGGTWYTVEDEAAYQEEVDADLQPVEHVYVSGTVGDKAWIREENTHIKERTDMKEISYDTLETLVQNDYIMIDD